MKAYRKQAGDIVANEAKYIGDTSPNYSYFIRFEGNAYFSNDTAELADQIAAVMRSTAAKRREHLRRRITDM